VRGRIISKKLAEYGSVASREPQFKLVGVRFGAHSGLMSEIAALPKSAKLRHDRDMASARARRTVAGYESAPGLARPCTFGAKPSRWR
jgi:hypothetical protein